MRGVLLVALACGVLGPQQPARDVPRGAPTGPPSTSRIAGVVQSAGAEPVPLSHMVVTAASEELQVGRSAISDRHGRFSIDDLPAGRFTVTAEKPGWLPATYGASAPGRLGIPVVLSANQQVDNLTLTVWPGAAIGGTVLDEMGQPVAGAAVTAARVRGDGVLASAASATATSDDRGQYRLFGLAPGRYVLSAAQPTIPFRTGVRIMSAAEIDAALADLARGVRRGARPAVAAGGTSDEVTVESVPVFYPGAANPADAEPVRLNAGEDRGHIDIVLQMAALATVEGTILNSHIASGVTITLVPAGSDFARGVYKPIQATPAGDGSFRFRAVRPGHYVVRARAAATRGQGERPLAPGVGQLWAEADIDVSGSAVSGISLVLQPALTVTGRVTSEPGSIVPPTQMKTLRLAMATSDDTALRAAALQGLIGGRIYAPTAAISADGTFAVTGVAPGAYALDVEHVPPGWWVRSAFSGDADVLDAPLHIAADRATPPLVIVLSDRPAGFGGVLEAPRGLAASDFSVVVMPADASLWRTPSRRVQAGRVAQDGRYALSGLPPGNYLVSAIRDLDPDDLFERAFLEAVAQNAVRIVVREGEMTTCNLRMGGNP